MPTEKGNSQQKSPLESKPTEEESPPSNEQVICPTCNGTKREEIQGGLVVRLCRTCKGEGTIPREQAEAIHAGLKKVDEDNARTREALRGAMSVDRQPLTIDQLNNDPLRPRDKKKPVPKKQKTTAGGSKA